MTIKLTEPIRVSEDASKATGNLFMMVILASERMRELRLQKSKQKMFYVQDYPASKAIREAELGQLDIPHLIKRIQKRS